MNPFKIHPSKISLVTFDRVMDGTVSDFSTMLSDTNAWLTPQRVEDGVTLNYSGEMEDFEEQGSSGVLVQKGSVIKRQSLQFTVNLGRWNFNIEQVFRGGASGDVADDQTASIEGSDDATSVTGLGLPTTLETQKFAALIEMPANKDDDKTLRLFLPKVGISFEDREQNLNHSQQTPSMKFKAYGLETSDPDELTPVQTIYGAATDDGLIFPVEGKPDQT
jgi:hypothetical protein